MTPTIQQYDAEIERRYPWVPWRDPVTVVISGESGLACRFCVARLGFVARTDRNRLFQTPEQFAAHLKETHGTEQHEN